VVFDQVAGAGPRHRVVPACDGPPWPPGPPSRGVSWCVSGRRERPRGVPPAVPARL
jgi:hypothetical protein